jgi:hypothetical protein
MLKRIILSAVFGLAPMAALVAAGCTSNNAGKPYSLTGSSTISEQERKEQLRWTDDKGHYRPDLRMQGGAPLHNVP